jgi:hypothetical protein
LFGFRIILAQSINHRLAAKSSLLRFHEASRIPLRSGFFACMLDSLLLKRQQLSRSLHILQSGEKSMIPRDPRNPAYIFIPEDAAATIPRLYSTEKTDNPIAVLKFFTPDSSWTWYLTEYDPESRLAFGLVIGQDREFGNFSLIELEELRGPMGLPVERDLHFSPTPISHCG